MNRNELDAQAGGDSFDEVLAEILQADGDARERLMQQRPEYEAALREFFEVHGWMRQIAGPASAAATSEDTSRPHLLADTADLQLRQAAPTSSHHHVPNTGLVHFGDYILREEIARGGMGVVYKAYQISLGRTVALKMIQSSRLASEADVSRFRSEAQAAAQLDHPGIVPVHTVGEYEGEHFYTMAFVDGQSLQEYLQQAGVLPPRAAADLVRRLAEAVGFAHQRGVIHRDLKPANVLLAESTRNDAIVLAAGDKLLRCEPKVTDFGLAKMTQTDSGLTGTGQILGTPSYMPPEQAACQGDRVGRHSDVYSLGAVLYCLLTGRPPFRAASVVETLSQVLHSEVVAPRSLNSAIPRDLETVCLKCLAKQPGDRYASAEAFVEDLSRFLDGQPILARPVTLTQRLIKWCRRRPATAALIVTSALAVMGMLGVAIVLGYSSELAQSRQEEARLRKVAERALGGAKTYLYFNRIGLAERAWAENAAAHTRQLLAECDPERRSWEWRFLDRLAHGEEMVLTEHKAPVQSITVSPHGQWLVSGDRSGQVCIWDAETGRVVSQWNVEHTVAALKISPDSRLLAIAEWPGKHTGLVSVWDFQSLLSGLARRPAPIATLPTGHVGYRPMAFTSDGRFLVTSTGWGEGSGEVHMYATEDWHLFWRHCVLPDLQLTALSVSPNGKHIACGAGRGDIGFQTGPTPIKILACDNGEIVATLEGHQGSVLYLAYSPDGRWLASASADKTVRIWNTRTHELARILTGHTAYVATVAFSPDGLQLASGGEDLAIRVWDVTTGELRGQIRGHEQEVRDLVFYPGGTLVSAGKAIRIWSRISYDECQMLGTHDGMARELAFHPGGNLVASAGTDHTLRLWNLVDPKQSCVLTTLDVPLQCVEFSPDGRFLAFSGGDWQDANAVSKVHLWSVDERKEIRTFESAKAVTWGLAFSPDGGRLAAAGGETRQGPGSIFVYDLHSGRKLVAIPSPVGIYNLDYTPAGDRILGITGLGNTAETRLIAWDASDGAELYRVKTKNASSYIALTIAPDGKKVYLADEFGPIFLHDVATGDYLRTLIGHSSGVGTMQISADGSRMFSAGWDQQIRVWDSELGIEVLRLKGQNSPVVGLALSPDGNTLVSAADNGSVCLWDARPRAKTPSLPLTKTSANHSHD